MAREPTGWIVACREKLEIRRGGIPEIALHLRANLVWLRGEVKRCECRYNVAVRRYRYPDSTCYDIMDLKAERRQTKLALKHISERLTDAEVARHSPQELNEEIDCELKRLDQIQTNVWFDAQLWDAAQAGNVSRICECFEIGIDPNTNSFKHHQLLDIAIINHHPNAVQCLLDGNVNPNFRGEPIKHALETNQYNIALMLTNAKAQIGREVTDAFRNAISKNDCSATELLIQIKANVHAKMGTSELPIHVAARCHNFDVVRVLVEHKANVNSISISHQVPLTIAVRTGCSEVVSELLRHKANVNAVTRGRVTATSAAIRRSRKTLRVLLQAKADPNQKAESYASPLHLAVDYGRIGAIRELLYAKADVNKTAPGSNIRPIDSVPDGLDAEKIRRILTA